MALEIGELRLAGSSGDEKRRLERIVARKFKKVPSFLAVALRLPNRKRTPLCCGQLNVSNRKRETPRRPRSDKMDSFERKARVKLRRKSIVMN